MPSLEVTKVYHTPGDHFHVQQAASKWALSIVPEPFHICRSLLASARVLLDRQLRATGEASPANRWCAYARLVRCTSVTLGSRVDGTAIPTPSKFGTPVLPRLRTASNVKSFRKLSAENVRRVRMTGAISSLPRTLPVNKTRYHSTYSLQTLHGVLQRRRLHICWTLSASREKLPAAGIHIYSPIAWRSSYIVGIKRTR